MNAALAVAMLRHQERSGPAFGAERGDGLGGLAGAAPASRARARSSVSREVWLDGGHNPSAARQIAAYARHRFDDGKPLHLIFASLATKDPAGMLEPFKGIVEQVHAVPIPDHGCFSPDDLVEIAASSGDFRRTRTTDVEQALGAILPHARVLIFGSLYLAGAVLAANDQVPN